MIELYIENRKIDLTEDLEINFTYETIDPDKLASIKNSFSKTVNIPGTANNNITFGHIFRYDKYIPVAAASNIENDFDPHKRVKWFINKNGSLVNRGYCVLDNILMNSERDITYQLTLYGGLGEFFYSLSYNEDGSPKTLADMFWNWFPKTSLLGHGAALDEGAEDTQTLYKASADIVASSYHSLNPLYTYEGTTDIDKDVVFVPCYTGLYEDFDSKHMLVSTFNQNYTPAGTTYVSDTKKAVLSRVFPDSFTDTDGTVYRTLDKNFSPTSSYRYGIVTFSRDIDPWEAGDIRVNELPVAIRLSKLMHVISQPDNNGGYEVIWDDDIKQSLHWLYGWVLLGKLKQDKENINKYVFNPNPLYDGQNVTVEYNYSNIQATTASAIEYDLFDDEVKQGTYSFNLNVLPKINFQARTYSKGWHFYHDEFNLPFISGYMNLTVSPGGSQGNHNPVTIYKYVWNTYIVIHKFYNGTTLVKSIADVFYFSETLAYRFGQVSYGSYENAFISNLKDKLNSYYGLDISEIVIHNCNPKVSEVIDNVPDLGTIYCDIKNQTISTSLEITSDSTLRVSQIQCNAFTIGGINGPVSGIWGVDTFPFNYTGNTFFGFVKGSLTIPDPFTYNSTYNFSITMNESKQNGFLVLKSSGFNIMNIDKKTLFANSKSPLSYLSGYCKLMNYKFVCDDTTQKIYIHTLKDYYKNIIISLDDRVDIGRSISIKNLTTKNKMINVGLDTPETYPVNLFNKNSREKFNTERYETGIVFPAGEANLLDNLTFKNTIDWQQSSIFYNVWPQIPRPYAQTSVSWTLFDPNSSSTEGLKTKEIFTPGVPNTEENLFAGVDFLPKISLFDKDNKFVDVESTLIFLNGFVKNYDYTLFTATEKTIQPYSTNPSHYINSSGEVASSQYQDIYIYNVQPLYQYFVTASYTSSYASYVVNYCDASGTVIGVEYPQANANLIEARLTLPAGTVTIRCNFRKADANAKINGVGPNWVISPKVMLSNDTYEQYYFNQSRCYVYDFKYNDAFVFWGEYSTDQKCSATSWAIPMFSRDLYNYYDSSSQTWKLASAKLASWNLVNQEGLDNMYYLFSSQAGYDNPDDPSTPKNTMFLKDPGFTYSKSTDNMNFFGNEYVIQSVPADDELTERIYDKNWKDYMSDLYNRNARDITAYVDLSGLGDATQIMCNIYSYKSHLWVITKLENFKISETTHDKFTKVTMHKINKLSTWTK